MGPQELEQFSRASTKVYLQMEDEIMANIARRIRSKKSLFDEIEVSGETQRITAWQLDLLDDVNQLNRDNIRTISKYSGEAVEEVAEQLERAGYRAAGEFDGELRAAANRGTLQDAPPLRQSERLQAIARTMGERAESEFNLINTTLLDQSQQVYRDVVNRTTTNVISGAQTPYQALRQVGREFADKGVPAMIDRAGRRWSTEAYVNMITRTVMNDVANEMQDARFDEYGQDLVEVSSHVGARPLCEPFQGRIFSRSGTSTQYPPLSETSEGEPAGLFGINCGHIKYPYFPGTKRTFDPVAEKENKKAYEEQQKQRYLERQIREAKRREEFFRGVGDTEGANQAKELVKRRQATMRGFINESGRTRRISREQVV